MLGPVKAKPFGWPQSRGHSAHIGQHAVIHYRWHPLYGQSVRRIQSERRASGEYAHVELTSGGVTIVPAWKLDAVYCAGLKTGTPHVSLSALCALRELLVACESRLVSSDGNTVAQEASNGIVGTAHSKIGGLLRYRITGPGWSYSNSTSFSTTCDFAV